MQPSTAAEGKGPASPLDVILIPLAEVEAMTGRRKTAIYADLADPDSDFPRPVRIGRSVRWVRPEVTAWIQGRIAARDAKVAA